ncbi:hypothetical protein Bca101_057752 [Brassica carinata]
MAQREEASLLTMFCGEVMERWWTWRRLVHLLLLFECGEVIVTYFLVLSMAMKPEVAPEDGKFDFLVSDLEAMFPEGMVNHNVAPVYKEVISLDFVLGRRREDIRLPAFHSDIAASGPLENWLSCLELAVLIGELTALLRTRCLS